MISPFNDRLEVLLFRRDEPRHVALQQKAERSLPLEDVAHESLITAWLKFVNVPQARERSAHHLIDEAPRPIDFNDPRRESLANSEVAAFKCDEIAELQHT